MPYYSQYVLVNEDTGIVHWHENHDTALQERKILGGVVYNTSSCDPALLIRALTAARHRMGVE